MGAVPPARHFEWALVLLVLGAITASAQTTITPPANGYSPAEDVELGREAATEARKYLPPVRDVQVKAYVDGIGRRLADRIPADLRQPAFEYSFDVVNLNEITSIALPGGPIFISRGMIEVAQTEDELAGIIAHQLSHIVLRHSTAQATRGEMFQVGGILGRTIGAVAGGAGEGIVAQGANFGVRTYFLMYGGEFERQADLLAAQIVAHAGYNPQDIAAMLHTIKTKGAGRGGPQWMSSHPNPDKYEHTSREEAIGRETEIPRIAGSVGRSDQLESIQARLAGMPTARGGKQGNKNGGAIGTSGYGVGVVVPSGQFRSVTAGDSLLLSVPANWERLSVSNTAVFAPDRALGNSPGGTALTHGVQVGVARSLTGSLEGDTQTLLESLGQNNPHIRWTPAYQRTKLGGGSGLTTMVSNVSPMTGQFEQILVSTGHLPDGNFLYIIGIAPQDEAGLYQNAFNRILESLQIIN